MTDLKPNGRNTARILAAAVLLLAVLAGELALSARQQSQTFDEACHIFAGYRSWKNFDFGINPEHPPLVKLVATLPLLGMPLQALTVADAQFKLVAYLNGRQFLYGNDADAILFRTRMAAALFTILLGILIFWVTRTMWGDGPALLSLAIFVFEPNFLAHGALVTTDVGVTFGFFLAVSAFYCYQKNPSVLRLAAAGIATGICLGTKHSGILILPILVLFALADLYASSEAPTEKTSGDLRARATRQILALAAIFFIAWIVLWSFYGFRYAARPAGLAMNPPLADFARQMGPGGRPILMQMARWHLFPESYLFGMADILSAHPNATYLFGKSYPGGQWFYFPSVFLIKSTVGFLLLCCLIVFNEVWRSSAKGRELAALLLPVLVYGVVALLSGINYGVRHLLPVFPFLIVLAAAGAWDFARMHRAAAAGVGLLVVLHAASSLRAFPNYIPYANEFWGGPGSAYLNLSGSNADWGQGLKALNTFINKRQIKDCWFADYTSLVADSRYYGISCKPLPASFAATVRVPPPIPQFVDGPVFLSSTEIAGADWGGDWANPYVAFRGAKPSAVIAGAILEFDGKVDLSGAAAVAHEAMSEQLLRSKQTGEALAEAEQAVALAPNRPGAHAARADALAQLGKLSEATEEYDQAKKMADAIMGNR
jgi:4-amino-4-deoxy-L-arabinose transferase-like glycosyltransferase